jgi:hypothetical protein
MSDIASPYAKYDGRRSSWERLTWIDATAAKYTVRIRDRKENDLIIREPIIETELTREITSPYPKPLINLFAGGLILALLGVALICFAAFAKSTRADLVGGILAVIGMVLVALTIFRGQDIEGRRHA